MEETEANALVTECNHISVVDAEGYKAAAQKRLLLKAGMEYFDDLYDGRISEAWKHHKALVADKRKFYEPLSDAYDRIGRLLAHFDSQQEALRQQQQREEERRRIEEQQRVADLAREMGAEDAARAIEGKPPGPVVVAKPVPKVEGLTYREDWRFRIIDESKVPREYLSVDQIKIGKVVRALKLQCKIPGVEVFTEKIPVQRS